MRFAPCLLHRYAGDFVIEATISAASHARGAGGLVVWHERRRLIRFCANVDHRGQIQLAWHDGTRLRCISAGVPRQESGARFLRLSRRGSCYTAHFSTDGEHWFTCGELEFESADSQVEAGLYAECSYDYRFPQAHPITFAGLHHWVDEEEPRLTAHPSVSDTQPFDLPEPGDTFHGMVGASRRFHQFCDQLAEVAGSTLPLMLTGETGTGKELAARAVHELSRCSSGPFIPVNIGVLPETLIESELFGYLRGAFTGATRDRVGLFEASDRGTLFMDEVGELPLALQPSLLRVLDSGEIRPLGSTSIKQVNTRCVAATNRDLAVEVAEGRFRQDFYFRFAEPVVVPPLRERRDDIPLLVAHFLSVHRVGSGTAAITRGAMAALQAHDWPDNIRGLQQVVQRGLAAASRHFGVSRLTIYRWSERLGLDLDDLRSSLRSP